MTSFVSSGFRLLQVASLGILLSACNSAVDEDMVNADPNEAGSAASPTQAPSTLSSGPINVSDNTTRASGTGTASVNGFSSLLFPGSRTGQNAPNTVIGNATTTTPSVMSGIAVADTVAVLTFDTSNSSLGQVNGNYDPATLAVTVAGASHQIASGGNRYTGQVIAGGRNMTAVHITPNAGMPTTGNAQFTGTGEVIYINAPTSQTFTGTMSTTIDANFATARVGITMTAPNGQVDGNSYTGPGNITISDLAITNQNYQQDAQTTGSVTGFLGAADLNSGSQSVQARGVFGGPNAQETGAVAMITDAANGTAILRTTASR